MNKIAKIALCIVLSLTCLVCFCACDEQAETPATESAVKQYITGRYELESIQWANGTEASGETLQASEDAMGDMYVELYSDSTAQLALYGQIHDMEFTDDTMSQIDNKLITYEFSVGNGRVILKQSGDTYTFKKQ